MRHNGGILNPRLAAAIVGLGHGQTIVIADAGLSVPTNVEVLDLSLVTGVPGFFETTRAIAEELVVERVTIAREMGTHSQALRDQVCGLFGILNVQEVSQEELKVMMSDAALVVRTGECTPYANAILKGGVAF